MDLYMACNEAVEHAEILHTLKYPFRLGSYYGWRGTDGSAAKRVIELAADGSHHILDSGLFSLMFGGDKGKLTTYDQFRDYALKYVEDVRKWGWKHCLVECDIQKVVGPDECIRLREEVFEPYETESGCEVMYVWHRPEGIEGLKRMAKRYERIALSVPELRIDYKGDTKKALIALLKIIRDTGATPRIHLLGNTETKYVTLPAESGDSSSWIYCESYGIGRLYNGRAVATPSIRSPRWKAWERACARAYPREFEALGKLRVPDRAVRLAACVVSYWRLMDDLSFHMQEQMI